MTAPTSQRRRRPENPIINWKPVGRFVAFVLGATSILSLLVEFYHWVPMRTFVLAVQLPATVLLVAMFLYDRAKGDGRLARMVWIGAVAGFVAAVAYDVYRLPFVFSKEWGLSAFVPALPLFKVFPRFGALILNQPVEQPSYSMSAQVVGWAYHFSNGITFGIMYMALIGSAVKRAWWWAVVFAVGLEAALLATPYTAFFSIKVGPPFIFATLTAHLVFGIFMGLIARKMATDGGEG